MNKPLLVKEFYEKYLKLDINKGFFEKFQFSHALIDGNDFVFIEQRNDYVVGLIAFSVKQNSLHNLFVEVLPAFTKQGIAKRLLYQQFNFAKDNDLSIKNSKYSDLGETILSQYNKQLSLELNVPFQEHS